MSRLRRCGAHSCFGASSQARVRFLALIWGEAAPPPLTPLPTPLPSPVPLFCEGARVGALRTISPGDVERSGGHAARGRARGAKRVKCDTYE